MKGSLLLIAASLAGCASHGPMDPWIDAPPVVSAGSATERTSPDRTAVLPEHATLADYVDLAMQRNPSIRAAEHRVEAARARIAQARSLDDPMLMVSPIGEMAQTASGEVGLMAGVSQKLPFPGKRGARGRIAEAQVAVADAALRQVRLDVVAKLHHAYWSHRLADRLLIVVAENHVLLEQVRAAADAAYRGGRASQQDVLRASVELAAIEGETYLLEQQRAAAAAQLNALIDRPVDAPLPAHAEVTPNHLDLRLADLLAQAQRHNPELAMGRGRIEAARQRLDLAKLERFPDVTVGVQYNQVMDEGLSPMSNGEDQWWLQFSMNLPIWTGRLSAMRDEARQEVLAGLASLHATRNGVAAELQTLLAQVDTQRRLVALFQETLTPQAQQALDASLAAYRTGRSDFNEVVDSARQLLEFRRLQDSSATELEKRISEIERVVGRSLGNEPEEVSP